MVCTKTQAVVFAPLLGAGVYHLGSCFLNLKANIITSCCGCQFSTGDQGGGRRACGAACTAPSQAAFFGVMGLTLASGVRFVVNGRGGSLFAAAGPLAFPVSVEALIAFISVYFYELPTHHYSFCILQQEYHYLGFLVCATLFGGGTASPGVWVLMPFRPMPSMRESIQCIQRRLAVTALAFYSALSSTVTAQMAISDFTLTGY